MIYTKQQVREAYEKAFADCAGHDDAVHKVAVALHISEADVEESIEEVCHG